MAVLLTILLFGVFLGIEYIVRPARTKPGKAVTGYIWPGYAYVGMVAQDGGDPYDDSFLGEGI